MKEEAKEFKKRVIERGNSFSRVWSNLKDKAINGFDFLKKEHSDSEDEETEEEKKKNEGKRKLQEYLDKTPRESSIFKNTAYEMSLSHMMKRDDKFVPQSDKKLDVIYRKPSF